MRWFGGYVGIRFRGSWIADFARIVGRLLGLLDVHRDGSRRARIGSTNFRWIVLLVVQVCATEVEDVSVMALRMCVASSFASPMIDAIYRLEHDGEHRKCCLG